jgi:hypothetical protein
MSHSYIKKQRSSIARKKGITKCRPRSVSKVQNLPNYNWTYKRVLVYHLYYSREVKNTLINNVRVINITFLLWRYVFKDNNVFSSNVYLTLKWDMILSFVF